MVDNSSFKPEFVFSHKFPESTYTYTERDVAIYALGVGACGRDAVDTDELKHLYHEKGQQFIKVLPTFSTLFSLGVLPRLRGLPGLQFDPRLLLHGQQYIELYKPLPSNATILNTVTVAGVHDKGKAAILELETKSYDKESGEPLSMDKCFSTRCWWLLRSIQALYILELSSQSDFYENPKKSTFCSV